YGVWLQDMPAPCVALSGLTVWRAADYAVYGFVGSSVSISNVTIVDSAVGVHVNVYGPPAITHTRASKTVSVSNSAIVGGLNMLGGGDVHTCPWRWSWGASGQPVVGRIGILLS